MNREQVIQVFRKTLNDFKRPYIEGSEEFPEPAMDAEEEPTQEELQMTGRVNQIFQIFTKMHDTLAAVITKGGDVTCEGLDEKALCAVFEKNGVFAALRADPILKDDLLRYLRSDLYEYPYTLNIELIQQFEKNGVNAIVPQIKTNEEANQPMTSQSGQNMNLD